MAFRRHRFGNNRYQVGQLSLGTNPQARPQSLLVRDVIQDVVRQA